MWYDYYNPYSENQSNQMSNSSKQNAAQRFSDRVKVGKLAGRLHRFVMSKPGDKNYDKVQMTGAQVQAAKLLIGKVVPDVRMVELKGSVEYSGDINTISTSFLEQFILGRSSDQSIATQTGKRTVN